MFSSTFHGILFAFIEVMNKRWLLIMLTIATLLLGLLKAHELSSLTPFYQGAKVIKLENFSEARTKIHKTDLDLLELWESMLTGRSAPLSRWMKERYQTLGLSHLFTPSGFHISAVLFPFLKLLKPQFHLCFILFLGAGIYFLPGMSALKRMLLIKGHQKLLGQKVGFLAALFLDVLFGSFQVGALSFTYSFLFLGIIYSGARGLTLIVWFFLAQILLVYFQGNDISPLILLFSPFLNFCFALAMPVLFVLALPLWEWQLSSGILILKILQFLVDSTGQICLLFPKLEVHLGIFLLIFFLLRTKKKASILCLILLSASLNLDRTRTPSISSQEYLPQGKIIKTTYSEKMVRINFEDGNCRMKLVRGMWWKSCSPKRGSSYKKFKKLSYPLKEQQKFSLRG